MSGTIAQVTLLSLLATTIAAAGPTSQPAINPNPAEPGLCELLETHWGLHCERDLRNRITTQGARSGLFHKHDPAKPVTLTPLLAFGIETTTHAGWYRDAISNTRTQLWSYAFKSPASDGKAKAVTPIPHTGTTTFDPGDSPFGLWVSNEQFADGGVFSQPAMVANVNARLREQPIKALIYPTRGPDRQPVRNSYVVAWEYSDNDDYQDLIVRIDNVRLIQSDPTLGGIIEPKAQMRKLCSEFKFTEGPAWDPSRQEQYFSDIPPAHIVRFQDGQCDVANQRSGQSNGLMFDRQGRLYACRGGDRTVTRGAPAEDGEILASAFAGKKLNSPNDLWLDADGGFYFTDPRYGNRDDLEQEKEAVYYVDRANRIIRVIDDLVRPNGIAISPDGRWLYVLDNGASRLYRYAITGPGQLAKGEMLAHVPGPDGMSVDEQGRLYITSEGGIWVLDGSGDWLGLIETPEHPANCTFGGTNWQTLYITARSSLYAINLTARGWHIHLDGPATRPASSVSSPKQD